MSEQDAYNEALNILSDKSVSIPLLQKYGVQAPISPNGLSNVNKQHTICISEELIDDLYKIHMHTKQTGIEVPFFLFGEERDDGSVLFDQMVIGKETDTQNADFKSIKPQLDNFIKHVGQNKLSNQVICHGHTHGRGPHSDNFSLADMAAYILMNDYHPLLKNKTIQTVGFVFNNSGDLNFVLHDDYNKGFYKFPNVNIEYNNGEKDPLPAYSRGNYNISNSR